MKKFITIFLLLAMISFVFISCDNKKGESNTDSTQSERTTYDFEGRTFTFLHTGTNAYHECDIIHNTYQDYAGEIRMSSAVNEAIRERNNVVEERLNIEIKEIYIADGDRYGGSNSKMIERIVTDITLNLQGDDMYYAAIPSIYQAAYLALSGNFYNLKDILDLEASWWDTSFSNETEIDSKVFFTVGELLLGDKAATPIVAFNKTLLTELNLKSPYDLVKDDEWTFDKMFEYTKLISSDLDSDDYITYLDRFGWSGQKDDMWNFFYASGAKIASIDPATDLPQLTMLNAATPAVMDKLVEMTMNKNYYVSANDYFTNSPKRGNAVGHETPVLLTIEPFLQDRCLFFTGGINSTDYFTSMENDFGIVPLPKYSKTQDRYYSLINPWVGPCLAIPISVPQKDIEFVKIVLEEISQSSQEIVRPAFFEQTLFTTRTRDDTAVEMLNLVLESRGCDIGLMYKIGGYGTMLQSIEQTGIFVSEYTTRSATAQADIDLLVEAFKNNRTQ